METITSPILDFNIPVKFTALAIRQVKKLLSENNLGDGTVLRVGVKGGGCSGLTYVLEFDKTTDEDQLFEVDGIQVAMNKTHGLYLFGMEVDFPEGLDARGFVFNKVKNTVL